MPSPRPTLCLAALLVVAAACSSGSHRLASTSSTASTASTTSTSSLPVTTLTPTTATTATTATTVRSTTTTVKAAPPTSPSTSAVPATVTAGDADNGKTITVPLGHVLVVTLNASNWTFSATSNPAVLSQTGATTQQRTPCVPGGTCGTTTATFTPHQTGSSQVIATRNYCGEAIQCTPATDHWAIAVSVTSH